MRTLQNSLLKSRFELYEDGCVVGLLHYEMHGGQMWILNIQTSRLCDGPNLVNDLISRVLVDARRRRLEIIPYCHAVRRYMAGRPHFVTLMPSDNPGHFDFNRGSSCVRPFRSSKTTKTAPAASLR